MVAESATSRASAMNDGETPKRRVWDRKNMRSELGGWVLGLPHRAVSEPSVGGLPLRVCRSGKKLEHLRNPERAGIE